MRTIQFDPPAKTPKSNHFQRKIPPTAGSGGVDTVLLKSGIYLSVSDVQLHQSMAIEYPAPQYSTGFGFCLAGQSQSLAGHYRDNFSIKAGESGLFHLPDKPQITEQVSAERLLRVHLLLKDRHHDDFMSDPFFAAAFEGLKEEPKRIGGSITPAMKLVLEQLLNCPYQGLLRDFFLEAKTLELLTYKLEQGQNQRKTHKIHTPLKSSEREQIHHVASLLIADLEHPPDIATLTRCAGMCRSKLLNHFSQVYDCSPAEYLRKNRLQKAQTLLAEGEINVSQAAYSVGYSSLSYFSRIFKKEFGLFPSEIISPVKNNRIK